jgi:NitT/TauT family transport system permease protein
MKTRYVTEVFLWPGLVILSLLLAWEAAIPVLGIRSIILPAPSEIIRTIVNRHDLLLSHLWPTLILTLEGFALSLAGGIAVAIAVTYSSIIRKGFYPVIIVSQVVPKISIAPLFIVWFGTGTISSLLLAFLVTFFPMTINSAMGFQSVDEEIHRMARAYMASPWQIFWKVQLPHALPFIFAGMKISITLAIIGVIVSEFVASQEGIGYLIKLSGGLLDTPLMMAAITVLSISGLVLYWIIAEVEKVAVYWQSEPLLHTGSGAA